MTTFPDNDATIRTAERVGFTSRGRAALLHAHARAALRPDAAVAPAGRAALGGLRHDGLAVERASARSTEAVMQVKIGVSDSV